METEPGTQISDLVERSRAGDEAAADELMPMVYGELRRIAGAYMKRERPGQTIQPTALVHEAYLRLLKDKHQDWQGRTHFLAIAATSMRQILVERARAKYAEKRGGGRERITLDESTFKAPGTSRGGGGTAVDLLAIDEALDRLAELDAQQARIVELRFFGGLTIEETAAELDISPATVKRHWTIARAWLRREVRHSDVAQPDPENSDGDAAPGNDSAQGDADGGR